MLPPKYLAMAVPCLPMPRAHSSWESRPSPSVSSCRKSLRRPALARASSCSTISPHLRAASRCTSSTARLPPASSRASSLGAAQHTTLYGRWLSLRPRSRYGL